MEKKLGEYRDLRNFISYYLIMNAVRTVVPVPCPFRVSLGAVGGSGYCGL